MITITWNLISSERSITRRYEDGKEELAFRLAIDLERNEDVCWARVSHPEGVQTWSRNADGAWNER